MKFHKIRCTCFRVATATNICQIHIDRRFSKLVKMYSGHLETCKTASLNFIRKKSVHHIYIEEMKKQLAALLVSYLHINYISVIFYCRYLVHKILCHSILEEPESAYPENSGESRTTAAPVE